MLFQDQTARIIASVASSAPSKAAAKVLKAQAWYEGEPYDGKDPDYVPGDDAPRTVLPIPKMLINKAAGLLFGKVPELTADDDDLQAWVSKVWADNKLTGKLLGWARVNAYAGAGWLKFVWNDTPGARNPWPIQYYHQGYVEPTYSRDFPDELEKVRIMYREEGEDGKKTWYCEEWTVDTYREWSGIPDKAGKPKWDEIEPTFADDHPYGCIPVIHWANIYDPELDPGSGQGDLDGLYSVLHRLNVTADDIDLALQLDAKGVWLANGVKDEKVCMAPGTVHIADGDEAFIKAAESGDPHLTEAQAYLKQLESWVFNAARIVYLDPKEVALGQLSSLAIRLIYGPSIELTEEKRRTAGEAFEELFEQAARAAIRLKKLKAPKPPKDAPEGHDGVDLELSWPELFNLTQQEIGEAQTNLQQAELAGWLTAQEARQKAAVLHGIRHTDQRDKDLDQAQDERLKEALNGAGQADDALEEDPDQAGSGKAGGRGRGGGKADPGS
jgi:hypothetical protein